MPILTPEATIGPFYPGVFVAQMPGGLATIAPQLAHKPAGEPITVTMRFFDANKQPVPSLIVEVWQANASRAGISAGGGRRTCTSR